MLGSSTSAFVVCLLSLCFSGLVNGVPLAQPNPVLMAPRQATTPTTITTTDTIQTATGPMLETCEITLTPDSSGSYQEVKSCSLSAIAVSSDSGAAATGSAVVVGTSSVASSAVFATGAAASVSSAAAAAATSAVGAIDNNAGGAAASVSAASSASTAAVSKTAVANAAVTFTVPGRHILILPVGLVVFCVITGIMLLIIVFQHFWRMQYRRAFRQRKLAEQGAPMGYGGMGKA
ncbi:hypothetical protein DAEQUDRAFT_728044 [Daedalea quercina L-15889]|uniref:Mid2 domain-containing protein n=1 Tax=Daedalea quercina L-15889 TaxID=1314783 RepID=A0A165PI63_9APHY|nr:hypothetical protein DAEQUDRAFT_728044 [Daedalea quercina L-15889]